MQQDLKQYYLEKAEVLRTEAATLRSRTRSFVVAELVSFALAVGLVIAYTLTDGGWTLLAFMAFVALAYLVMVFILSIINQRFFPFIIVLVRPNYTSLFIDGE